MNIFYKIIQGNRFFFYKKCYTYPPACMFLNEYISGTVRFEGMVIIGKLIIFFMLFQNILSSVTFENFSFSWPCWLCNSTINLWPHYVGNWPLTGICRYHLHTFQGNFLQILKSNWDHFCAKCIKDKSVLKNFKNLQ